MAARPRPPPPLVDDVIIEILLRLPPDGIACAWLARASLVCKTWRRLLADRTFLRRYREIYGATPVLGFLYNKYSTGASSPLFLHTTQPSPFPRPASHASIPTYCRTLDCRHGRVLVFHPASFGSFTVWDPITGKERCFFGPLHSYVKFTEAVLCASNGCDHIGCSGGPFLVVLLKEAHRVEGRRLVAMAQACLYSSETGKWSVSASIDFHTFKGTTTPSLLTGDSLFFLVIISDGSRQILKYDLTRGVLSAIGMPPDRHVGNMILCTSEEGGLGVAAVDGCSRLFLLSGQTDPDGVMRWVLDRALELDSMIPLGVGGASSKFFVVGFAEGTGYVFVRANDSIFSVELMSGRISKIGSGKLIGPIFPLMGFYIPYLASIKFQVPMRIE